MIQRLCIAGVGLIGGSLALALKEAGAVGEVVGAGRDAKRLQQAVDLGIIDRYSRDAAEAAEGADMVVLAVPLGAIGPVTRALAPGLAPDAVVTDVGSAKASVVADVLGVLGQAFARFVPGHPIAGTERSGCEAAFAGLFRARRVILTPLPQGEEGASARVEAMWQAAGAEVERMSVAHHDEVLAATSHLPHMLAFGLVDGLARMRDNDEIFRYAAGGFRDFTRIASSDPVMWRDVCLANREAILGMMRRYTEDLRLIEDAIEQGDGEALLDIFTRAKAARDRFCQ